MLNDKQALIVVAAGFAAGLVISLQQLHIMQLEHELAETKKRSKLVTGVWKKAFERCSKTMTSQQLLQVYKEISNESKFAKIMMENDML